MLASNSHCTVSSNLSQLAFRASLVTLRDKVGLVSDYSVTLSGCLLFGELADGENFLTLLLTAERSYPTSSPNVIDYLGIFKCFRALKLVMKKTFAALVSIIVLIGVSLIGLTLFSVLSVAKGQGQPDEIVPGSLQKFLFIHYEKGHKPQHNPGGNGAADNTCSKLLGVKWKQFPVSYVVHPDLESAVSGAIAISSETWDAATSKELFNDVYTVNSTANFDGTANSRDSRNEHSYGNFSEPGVIAVTVVWAGIPIGGKGLQILESDILYDTDFAWGNAGPTNETAPANVTIMDLQNIATHEIGHQVGEDDIYDTACSEITMFGFSTEGETKKRTLAAADISGLQKMYGA